MSCVLCNTFRPPYTSFISIYLLALSCLYHSFINNASKIAEMAGYSTPPMGKCGLNCAMCPYVQWKKGNNSNAFNCNSQMTVYLINCDNCEQNYLGYCTGRLVDSLKYHLNEVNNSDSLFAQHFRRCGINSLKIQVIDQGDSRRDLIEKTKYWENWINPTIGSLGTCLKCEEKIKTNEDLNYYKGSVICSDCMDEQSRLTFIRLLA